MTIRSFEELRSLAMPTRSVRASVAGGNDPSVLKAVEVAISNEWISGAVITGDPRVIHDGLSAQVRNRVEILASDTLPGCASTAVSVVRGGQAEFLIKGHVDSTSYLRAVVDRKTGLRDGGVLSNITVAEMPAMNRLIAATDNGILPAPDLNQKREIVRNTATLFRGLGVSPVKVAAICATEKVSDALPATRDAEALAGECLAGKFDGFEIGGPMGYDVAVSMDAARSKGLDALPAAGSADLLLFPTIDAANAVAKSWKFHGQAKTGSIVLGARVPVLLNSRSDSAERRVNALLLALATLNGGEP